MVATRRSTRVEPEEAAASGGQQAAVESSTSVSPKQTEPKTVKSDPPAEDRGRNIQNQGESTGTTGSPSKNDIRKGLSQVVTRSRNRSGQSDADVSEAESTTSTSSTRLTRSRQSLGSMTDSARQLRSCRSTVITEPILESKEDEELSEPESNCSSVSTRASRRTRATRPTRASSRKFALLSEPISDLSEAESNCSSVSGLQNTAVRSTRATRSRSVNTESQKEEISDAESYHSDFVPQTRARCSSRRVQSRPQAGEGKSVSGNGSQEQESPKRYSLRGVKVTECLSSVQKEDVFSSPCRNLRNRIVNESSDIIVLSDSDSRGKDFPSKDSPKDQRKADESLEEQPPSLSVEHRSVPEQKLPATPPSTINIAPTAMIDLTEEVMDEPQPKDQGKPTDDDDEEEDEEDEDEEGDDDDHETADITNKDFSNLNTETQGGPSDTSKATKKVDILLLDSDESEKSEDSEEDDDVEMEEEEGHDNRLKKEKLKLTITKQMQEVADNGLFVIDTAPGLDAGKKYYVDHHEDDIESDKEPNEEEEHNEADEEEEDFIDEEARDDDDEEEELLNRPKRGFELSSSIDTGLNIKQLGGLYINFDAEKANPGSSLHNKIKKESKKKDELLKKSIITPDFEKRESVPPYRESQNKLKKLRKAEREKTSGQGWFDMKAPEMTEELKNDLKALKMRSAMDPKHFYKKDDREGFPKYFQVGTVVDNPLDYFHSRIPKKQRKRTIVEELIVDSEFRRYNKKKYQEIMAEKAARAEGKKNRKKKKFRT